jgi:ferredoxin-NADP reductase
VAELRSGQVPEWRNLSPILAIFRLEPAEGHPFPGYQAGQYMALRREDCRLTRRVVGQDGRPHFVPDVDESGRQKHGPVTHSYSIASAPFETARDGHLEFYVVLEEDQEGHPGRLTESLFRVHPEDRLTYVDRIVGDFTLAKRASGFRSVLFVGTGTGLAPFISMVKQLDREAVLGRRGDVRYTLIHTNRTREELAYDDVLTEIEQRGAFDFAYVPSVSRPRPPDFDDPHLGVGRANNVLRILLGLPTTEQEALDAAEASGGDVAIARGALSRTVAPRLPRHHPQEALLARIPPSETVILTCGNPALMEDIRRVAELRGFRFEKEDW